MTWEIAHDTSNATLTLEGKLCKSLSRRFVWPLSSNANARVTPSWFLDQDSPYTLHTSVLLLLLLPSYSLHMRRKPTDPSCRGNTSVWSRVTALLRVSLSPMTTSQRRLIRVRDAPEIRTTVDSITGAFCPPLCSPHTLSLAVTKKPFVPKHNFARKSKQRTVLPFFFFFFVNSENVSHEGTGSEIRIISAPWMRSGSFRGGQSVCSKLHKPQQPPRGVWAELPCKQWANQLRGKPHSAEEKIRWLESDAGLYLQEVTNKNQIFTHPSLWYIKTDTTEMKTYISSL